MQRTATPASVPGTLISVNLSGSPRTTVRCLPGTGDRRHKEGGGGGTVWQYGTCMCVHFQGACHELVMPNNFEITCLISVVISC